MTEAEAQILRESTYIGDGVYLHVDTVAVTLLTTDGVDITNRVHLETATLALFQHELERRGLIARQGQ